MKLKQKGSALVQITLAKVIITLIVLVVLLTIVYVWQEEVTGGVDSKKCKLEVVRVSQTSKIPGINDKYLTAYCPSKEWGVLELKKEGEREIRKLAINLVQEMVDCWDKFGEGKLNPVKGTTGVKDDILQLQKTHCFVCTSFRMPKELPAATWGEFGKELDIVLKNNDNARNFLVDTLSKKSTDHYDYHAQKVKVNNELVGADIVKYTYFSNFHLQADKSYYLTNVFVVNKKLFLTNAVEGETPLNSYETHSKLVFVEESNFENVCTQLEN